MLMRVLVLSALIAIGAAGTAVSGCRAKPEDGPKIATIDKVRDNLYVIKGGGGNTAAFITGTGVVLVDTKLPGWGQPILDKVRTVTDHPVTMIINTHAHPDHVRSNEFFPTTVDIVAQENTKVIMQRMPGFKGDNAKFLPKKTFSDRMSVLDGKDRIDLYYFGAGHTDGDAIVVFPALRAAHFGDLFAGKYPPTIDTSGGGSAIAYPGTLSKAVAGIENVDTIITGHSDTVMTWDDLREKLATTSSPKFLGLFRGVVYEYSVAGRDHQSSLYRFGGHVAEPEISDALGRFRSGGQAFCWVDPADPERAVLLQGFSPKPADVAFAVGCLVVGAGLLITSLLLGRRIVSPPPPHARP